MKIEFRNIHVIERLSQETPCFTADLYVDGVLEAYVSNRGNGGGNDYSFPEGRDWLTLDCIEARVAALRLKHVVDLDGETIELDVDLELLSFLSL